MQNLSYENEFDLDENEPVGGTHLNMNSFARKLVLTQRQKAAWRCAPIGPLHDRVTWYGINYTGTQIITQWDFQNKGKLGWTGASSFVLEVPLRNLRPSVIYSVPCDRIMQRANSAWVSLRIDNLHDDVI